MTKNTLIGTAAALLIMAVVGVKLWGAPAGTLPIDQLNRDAAGGTRPATAAAGTGAPAPGATAVGHDEHGAGTASGNEKDHERAEEQHDRVADARDDRDHATGRTDDGIAAARERDDENDRD